MAVFHPSARSLCEQRLDNRQFEPTRELALAAEWTYKVPGVGEWWQGWTSQEPSGNCVSTRKRMPC
jgi:hypothetical protein